MEERTIEINGVTWVREKEASLEVATVENNNSVAKKYIGKFVIVRTRNEGINAGTVVDCDETGIELSNCRRIWYHKPKNSAMSWYEGVALSGLSEDSKVSPTVSGKILVENYSMTFCTASAERSIMGMVPNAQNN